jgi:2-polyprenyl-3-methyl-5-hydroxy-6-metoxy-1,4-benzoquinol methylase
VTNPQPNPVKIFETLSAFHASSALKGAIDLDVFTAIAEGNRTTAEIANRCGAAERGIHTLCNFLTVHGFLTKDGKVYGLAPDAAVFLNRKSPAYMGGVAEFLMSDTMLDYYRDAAAFVRKGGCAVEAYGTTETEHPVWVKFARVMGAMMSMPANVIADRIASGHSEPWKVLDIAAGHGLFGVNIGQRNPNAQIYALDWAAVLEVAKENARNAGLADRYHTIPGSAFDVEIGSDYDLVLLTNFLHHFDVPTCETLLRKIHGSLKPGGRVLTLEFVPNEDKISPPMPATFSMVMLASTPSGDAYTFSELESMFRNAGYSGSVLEPVPPTEESLVISTR